MATLSLLACLAIPGRAADDAPFERGRFIIYEGGEPVATERFAWSDLGDSLALEADHSRRRIGPDGTPYEYHKRMVLFADRVGFGLLRYLSNERPLPDTSQLVVRGVEANPADTVASVYVERFGAGDLTRLVVPPGRVFVVDPLMFSLFDVICRNLHPQTFRERPVQLITFGGQPQAAQATVQRGALDTLRWGGKPVVTRRYTFRQDQARFDAWVNREGQMLRFEAAGGQVRVEREAPPVPSRNRPRG